MTVCFNSDLCFVSFFCELILDYLKLYLKQNNLSFWDKETKWFNTRFLQFQVPENRVFPAKRLIVFQVKLLRIEIKRIQLCTLL